MSQLLGRSSVLILRVIFGPTYSSTLKKEAEGCPEIALPKPHLTASRPAGVRREELQAHKIISCF